MKKSTLPSKAINTFVRSPVGTDLCESCAEIMTDESPQNHMNGDCHKSLRGFHLTNGNGDYVELPSAIRAEILKKRFRRQTGNLATSLMTALKIDPYGTLLVPICGSGREADNTEAVLYWVRNCACCPSCILTLSFSQMQHKFVRFLLDQTGQEYYE